MSKTSFKTTAEWHEINWRKLERIVYKLQKRIYQASNRGDIKAVRKLQKTLMKSWSARALAVRKVTQDNQGKKTAGVDGVKSLTPKQRLSLTGKLQLGSKVKPTRRVWIPKPGTDEKRPLGIPTINDRALQSLAKLALEPEWEAKFEPNSYGFRPGRSCQDAVGAIFDAIRLKAKYVLDADIAKCFDRINHEALLSKINTFPTLRRQVRAWLEAGVMDGKQLFPTFEGTPQGGVISPLLANIALHEMENRVKQYAETLKGTKRDNRWSLSLIRYADDFVILHESLDVVNKCREIISEWLLGMGLKLKPTKTRLTHTLNEYENEKPGFNFLGFNIRQYKVGKYHSARVRCKPTGSTRSRPLGFITIISPSKEKQIVHYDHIASTINSHRAMPQEALIKVLNPIIRGWGNYYATVVSKETYQKLDHLMYWKLRDWARHRHPKKSGKWHKAKYWKRIGDDNQVFATTIGGNNHRRLLRHGDIKIIRHVKVKGESSPYDGNLVYWSSRIGDNPEMPKRVSTLLKRQKGKCAYCETYFRENDVMEVDHKIPKSQGGKDSYDNWQLLHRHCHDTKTAIDGSSGKKSGCKSTEPKPIKETLESQMIIG